MQWDIEVPCSVFIYQVCYSRWSASSVLKMSGLFWLPCRPFKFVRRQNSDFELSSFSLNTVMTEQHFVGQKSNFGFVAPQRLHAVPRDRAHCHNELTVNSLILEMSQRATPAKWFTVTKVPRKSWTDCVSTHHLTKWCDSSLKLILVYRPTVIPVVISGKWTG